MQPRCLAANQGLYNGFPSSRVVVQSVSWLAAGVIVSRDFSCCAWSIAGVYGAATVNRRIFFIQSLPALLGLSDPDLLALIGVALTSSRCSIGADQATTKTAQQKAATPIGTAAFANQLSGRGWHAALSGSSGWWERHQRAAARRRAPALLLQVGTVPGADNLASTAQIDVRR